MEKLTILSRVINSQEYSIERKIELKESLGDQLYKKLLSIESSDFNSDEENILNKINFHYYVIEWGCDFWSDQFDNMFEGCYYATMELYSSEKLDLHFLVYDGSEVEMFNSFKEAETDFWSYNSDFLE